MPDSLRHVRKIKTDVMSRSRAPAIPRPPQAAPVMVLVMARRDAMVTTEASDLVTISCSPLVTTRAAVWRRAPQNPRWNNMLWQNEAEPAGDGGPPGLVAPLYVIERVHHQEEGRQQHHDEGAEGQRPHVRPVGSP